MLYTSLLEGVLNSYPLQNLKSLEYIRSRRERTSESGELALALADDHQVEDLDIRGHNAAADGLTLALTLPALAVARGALLKKKADTLSGHHTLLHGETLLVVSARDLEDVPLELITEDIANHLLVHALVIELAPAQFNTH